jgi:hypothetical protein
MNRNVLLLLRGVVGMAGLMVLLSAAGVAADLLWAGRGLPRLSAFDLNEARHLTNVFSRACNQLMMVLFTTVAIAVPLTANMYSLKFLEFFIKDRVNAAALILVVFSNLNNTLLSYALKEGFIPVIGLHAQLVIVASSFALLFPYLYYVFRFLHPNTLLDRLEAEIESHIGAARHGVKLPWHRSAVCEGIEHVANIGIRSVDRSDRNTAIESVLVLERVMRSYWRTKAALPAAWFEAEGQLFLSFSSKAMEEINASRSFVEMKLLSQLGQVMSAGIVRMHDLTASVVKTLRKLGLEEPARRDPALREMVMEYFNTFVRLAINHKDTRSVFTLFDQYRTFAESLNAEHPRLVLEIANYFGYYAQVARGAGLTFIVESVAHDLGTLVRHTWETGAPNAPELLRKFLEYDAGVSSLPGVKKAQAILASYFLLCGRPDLAGEVRKSFDGLEPALVNAIREDLLRITREKYWEVNERRLNMDYVPAPQRRLLAEFLESVAPTAAGPGGSRTPR